MSLRFHEIAEARHRILNPYTDEKLTLLGEICAPKPGMRHLDLACGKAEMLCRWAAAYGTEGVGVDISGVFLAAAEARAQELAVAAQVSFTRQDAATYAPMPAAFDLVSCIGATWIGQGLEGTLALMKPALKPRGLLLVGEPYWISPPSADACEGMGIGANEHSSLAGTLDRFEGVGCELVELVLANPDSWDRYVASQWLTVNDWLADHPLDADAPAIRDWIRAARRAYLTYERQYLGWGVFVLRLAD